MLSIKSDNKHKDFYHFDTVEPYPDLTDTVNSKTQEKKVCGEKKIIQNVTNSLLTNQSLTQSLKLDLFHNGFVSNSRIKCVVCWYVCGEGALMQRCDECFPYNRRDCKNCHFPIKVHIDEKNFLCEYCGGECLKIHDIRYQTTSCYYQIVNTEYNHIPRYNICNECLVSNQQVIVGTKLKCDWCKKYKSKIALNYDSMILKKVIVNCISCHIHTDEHEDKVCKICMEKYDPLHVLHVIGTSEQKIHYIGKRFQILVNKNYAHPKMKFERHLVDKYPDKYGIYKLFFTGDLITIESETKINFKLEFKNIDVLKNKNKSWIVDLINVVIIKNIN